MQREMQPFPLLLPRRPSAAFTLFRPATARDLKRSGLVASGAGRRASTNAAIESALLALGPQAQHLVLGGGQIAICRGQIALCRGQIDRRRDGARASRPAAEAPREPRRARVAAAVGDARGVSGGNTRNGSKSMDVCGRASRRRWGGSAPSSAR